MQENFSLIGTLYSREGVSIILRNLCLNPQINTVFVWGNNPLSKTAIGKAGRELLWKVWENGIDNESKVLDSNEQLHKQLHPDIITKVIQNVELIDVSELGIDEILKIARNNKRKESKYMTSISFPEEKRNSLETFPSEEVGWAVRGKKLTNTWIKVVDKILRYGKVSKTDYGNSQREIESITWTIESEDIHNFFIPDWPQEVQNRIGLSSEMREQYINAFLNPTVPAGTSYTYGSRLNDYPGNINQVQEMINSIKKSSITRRAVATTLYPEVDFNSQNPPCLNQIQVLISEGKINFFALFRSHDIFKAAVPNAYGLLNLQTYIAQQTGFEIGKLSITSISAHMYEEDWEMAEKLVKCSIWERNKKKFDEYEDIDPRGLVRISLQKNEICFELISTNGEQLFEYYGKTAREVIMKISHLDLLSRADHYCDVSIELTKAELALKTHVEFMQDRPLQIAGVTLI